MSKLRAVAAGGLAFLLGGHAAAQTERPNILVIWGDDIGITNIGFNNRGLMGSRTPNIDRIAQEGVSFTDYYGQQSCTAGRAAFIGGNNPLRTGMTKVGLPGAKLWRRILSEQAHREGAGPEVVQRALEAVEAQIAAREAA